MKGDKNQDPYVLFLKMTPSLVLGDALKGGLRDPSERQVESI